MDIKDKYAWWLVLVDALSSLFGLCGLILFALNFHTQELDLVFRFGYPIFVMSCLYIAAIDLYDLWKDKPEEWKETLATSLLGVVLVVPSYFICYWYAFGG